MPVAKPIQALLFGFFVGTDALFIAPKGFIDFRLILDRQAIDVLVSPIGTQDDVEPAILPLQFFRLYNAVISGIDFLPGFFLHNSTHKIPFLYSWMYQIESGPC